jgi:hypothetical protein
MTNPHEGGVLITLADIYKLVVGLAARVDTALSKHERTEQIVAEHDAELRPLAGAAEKLVDHEARLRSLERSRWPLASLAVLLPIAALAVTILIAVYKK